MRLPDALYETVRRYAEDDSKSMNGWIEGLLDIEDMRRRCAAHEVAIQQGAAAGGSQAPVVNSCSRASRLSRPHLAAVDR